MHNSSTGCLHSIYTASLSLGAEFWLYAYLAYYTCYEVWIIEGDIVVKQVSCSQRSSMHSRADVVRFRFLKTCHTNVSLAVYDDVYIL